MALYNPTTSTGLGSFLMSQLIQEPCPAGVPLYQIQSRRVPVISALQPGSTHYRMLSYVTGNRSIPMCFVTEKYSSLVSFKQHNVCHAEFLTFGSMTSKMSEEDYLEDGVPVEYGYGHLLALESRSYRDGTGIRLGVSAQAYEIYLILSQLRSFLHCLPEMKQHEMQSVDPSECYEPAERTVTRHSLRDVETLSTNDVYENLARYICGSTHYEHGQILKDCGFILNKGLQSAACGDRNGLPCIEQVSFKLHRIVSIISFIPIKPMIVYFSN